MDAKCAICDEVIPEADLLGMVYAEEENRRYREKRMGLMCEKCYIAMIWNLDEGPEENPEEGPEDGVRA